MQWTQNPLQNILHLSSADLGEIQTEIERSVTKYKL